MATIEEKARAYDIALEKIELLLGSGSSCSREELEYVFPELRESEDERIRKEIIDYLKQRLERASSIPTAIGRWINWLEAQGEQKPLGFNIGDEITVNGQICKVVAVEQKATEWSEEDEINLGKAIWYAENPAPKVAKNAMLVEWLKNLRGRVQPQKQEWSEKDKDMIGNIRTIIERYAFSQSAVDVNGDLCEKEYIDADNWLKNLKDRCVSKSKQEVSSDISIVIEDLRELLCNAGQSPDWVFNLIRDIDILNSLKHLNRWKPTDEQMEALNEAIYHVDDSVATQLSMLIGDLKKLN